VRGTLTKEQAQELARTIKDDIRFDGRVKRLVGEKPSVRIQKRVKAENTYCVILAPKDGELVSTSGLSNYEEWRRFATAGLSH